MITALKLLFNPASVETSLPGVLNALLSLINHFEAAKLADGTTRNAAIDTFIGLLENEKN